MPDDPFAKYAVSGPDASPQPPPSGTDPFAKYAVGGPGASASPSASPSPESGLASTPTQGAADPFAKYAVGSTNNPTSPENGQPPENPNAPWYKKAWGWANKPLFDVDDALGRTGQAGGFERGANDLVSGLTSPLSIALTLATFGTGGLVESGAASALKAAGLGADAIADVTKGSQIISDAIKAGKSAPEGFAAAEAAGINPVVLKQGLDALRNTGLDTDSLLSRGLARRAGSSFLRNLGVNASKAEDVGKGLQALTSAGFTLQNAYQAATLSPKVLDALRDGDYETAKRLAVDALGMGALAGLGAHETAQESGALMSDVGAKLGLHVNPAEENLALRKNFGIYDADVVQSGRTNKLWEQDLRKQYPKTNPIQQERILNYVQSGLDDNLMARRHNALAENAGVDKPIPLEEEDSSVPVSTGFGPERMQEIINNHTIKSSYSPEEVESLLNAYDPRKLTDTDKEIAAKVRDKFAETLINAQKEDALSEGVENYATQMWKPGDEENEATNLLRNSARVGNFSTGTSQAMERTFDSAFEGQMLGKKLAETDPISLAAHNANVFSRVIAARKAMARLQDEGVRTTDGRPVVAAAGTGQISDANKPAVFINPGSTRSLRISDQVVDGLRQTGDLNRMLKEEKIVNLKRNVTPENIGTEIGRLEDAATRRTPRFDAEGNNILRSEIETLKGVRDGRLPIADLDKINAQRPDIYAWNPYDYEHVDHPSLKNWTHVVQSPHGDEVFVKSDLRVHPEAAEYLRRRLGIDTSGPGEGGLGKAILKGNREGKGLLLFGSPFHVAQEGLRAVMTGVSPFGIERWDLANDPVLRHGVENGLTLGKDHRALEAFKDGQVSGNSALLAKVPGLNKIQSGLDHFLFDKYVPGLKARTYRNLAVRYAEAYPDWTPEKVAQVAAADTNERFGGINYKQLGRSAATQNWLKIVSLAPDWLEGELRAILRPFGTEGKVARYDMVRATIGLWGAARILNYLNSGKFHNETPFGVATQDANGKEKVYSIRTLPTDMLHAVSDPVGFVQGRFSPLVKAGTELVTGRDDQGRRLEKAGLAADLLRAVSPIPLQTVAKSLTGEVPDLTTEDQAIKAVGGTVMPYKTEAEKLAAQIASDHSESGPVDPSQLRRHHLLMEFEDRIRSGQMSLPQIWQMAVQGNLPQADAKKITDNLKMTRGMTQDMAELYTRASRAPAPDLLRIWDAATPAEKQTLTPLILKARKNYIKKAMTNETPEERTRDPILRRYINLMPQASPF